MKKKVMVLFMLPKKAKRKTKNKRLGDIIELEAPDMYEFIYSYGENETLKLVDEYHPEILFMPHVDEGNSAEVIKKIKRTYPAVQVFVVLSNTLSDEQEVIDEYMEAGAYKCFFSLLNIETLLHDMYVSLNLE